MEMHLQPLANTCVVSGRVFAEGDRVASFLVRADNLEIVRYDVLEDQLGQFLPAGFVACRWVHPYKPRRAEENSERTLKLTAENLFTTLADPAAEVTTENVRLVQFLALMLERKKILRPKGLSADRQKNVFEHSKTKQLFEVPAGELTPEFFVAVQEQLSVLVGSPKPKAKPAEAAVVPAKIASSPVATGTTETS